MRHNTLADAFSMLKNFEKIGRPECSVKASNLVKDVLEVMKKHGYIQDAEYVEDGKGGVYRVKLTKRINDCNVILPHFDVRLSDLAKYEKRYLPAFNIGLLILTTSKGVMGHNQARQEGTGGRLLGYVY
ncbi:MAG: 30S ribosomal protein S8 [Candidatus Aenigmarchaeota archaeon]|nr:30S ribosomal protein S8 [Candidatus Aenigmarchaeota archaeon]